MLTRTFPQLLPAGRLEQIGRTVAVAGMVGIRGNTQREGRSCMRLRAQLFDRSAEHASVEPGVRAFLLPHRRGDEFHYGSPTPDPRGYRTEGSEVRALRKGPGCDLQPDR